MPILNQSPKKFSFQHNSQCIAPKPIFAIIYINIKLQIRISFYQHPTEHNNDEDGDDKDDISTDDSRKWKQMRS